MTPTEINSPFALLLHPEVVVKAMEASERLTRLHSRICRPLDRQVVPPHKAEDPVAAFDAAIDRASARRTF